MSNEKDKSREYPFNAWVLGGTFILKQVVIVKKSCRSYSDWLFDDNDKSYCGSEIFASKEEAIAYGESKLAAQEEKILKQQAGIAKKRANLEKSK